MTDWLSGGLGKYRNGGDTGDMRFSGIVQGTLNLTDDLSAIAVARADQDQVSGVDALEAYFFLHPQSDGPVSWSVKGGAFFPTISLENDDLGWDSPYTLTYSAINSWIGEELRTIGSEGTLRWRTDKAGTFSVIGAFTCCNDEAGILMADRGWAMGDRPTGLFERVRLPDASLRTFRAPVPGRTGMFDEIDDRIGWYAGLTWQMANIGKLSVLRYDNEGNPAAKSVRDTAWDTRFYAYGFRTQIDSLVLIAQGLQGQTIVVVRPGLISDTKFQSAFLLASYDLTEAGFEDWRASARMDVFQTRHVAAAPHAMSEDGRAMTLSLSWQGTDWLRITGEGLLMHSRRGQYIAVGVPSGEIGQKLFQLDARIFF